MLCVKCKKRLAVVYIARMDEKTQKQVSEGYCLVCAKELNLGPVNDMMEKMGIGDDEIEAMSDQMTQMADSMEDSDMFTPGGAQPFPFLQNLMGQNMSEDGVEGIADSVDDESDLGEESSDKTKAKTKDKTKKKKKAYKHLDTYCTNLTEKARALMMDRVVGRDKEIARVVQILSRRTKNNPCLIGQPGVGKTAIAEGLAMRIAEGIVPKKLAQKDVYLLDLAALVAGTQFRGQFESRIKGLVNEIKEKGNVILFIDEVHSLVGTGDSEGSMNAANILKPALSRGDIQVIGATTFEEYRKYIEKDAALERRFQPVTVEEPTIDQTIEMLDGIKEYYEQFHRVKVSPRIIKQATMLSERYINDRYLPDKAIDLLDEACAAASLRFKEGAKYDEIVTKLENLKTKEEEMTTEKGDPDYEKIAEIKSEILKLQKLEIDMRPIAMSNEVTEEDLAKVIELWTGIPSSKVKTEELAKLCNLENKLKERIVGQDEAVRLLTVAIKRSRVKISSHRKPASFLFVGPTGVGKTELVKVLTKELFENPDALIRLDMSEYMEKYTVSRLIGSPPGYIGHDSAGQLTEKVRRKPYSVVLFDEIEKAHPDVLNILLQILDDGRVTDAQGRTVNFENTVVIMTSNAGSTGIDNGLGFTKSQNDIIKERALKALKQFLRPEFMSRIDEIIVFKNLTKENFKGIAEITLKDLRESLAEQNMNLEWDDEVTEFIAEKTFGGKFSGRDVRTFVRRNVEDKIAEIMVEKWDNPPTDFVAKLQKNNEEKDSLIIVAK